MLQLRSASRPQLLVCAALAALSLVLGACTATPPEPTRSVTSGAAPDPARPEDSGDSGDVALPAPRDLAVLEPEAGATPRAAVRPSPRPVRTLPPVNTDPRQFIGLSAGELVGRLGVPSFRRIDRPAMVWQYRRRGCIVDVFLYRENGRDRVIEVLVRAAGGIQRVSDGSCLGGLLRERAVPQSG